MDGEICPFLLLKPYTNAACQDSEKDKNSILNLNVASV